jgi:hypothetical protein
MKMKMMVGIIQNGVTDGGRATPLHDDKVLIVKSVQKTRDLSVDLQERQCEIWQRCDATELPYSKGRTSSPDQGRKVKEEDVLVRSSNMGTQQKTGISKTFDEPTDDAARWEREMQETHINNCLQDESRRFSG